MPLAPLFLDALVADEAGAIAFDPAKLAAATASFEAALQSGDPTAVTQELLTVAFFLDVKKGARDAATQVVAVARRAVPLLRRAGVAFDDIAAAAEKKTAALLGQETSKVPVGQTGGAGARWWQLR